VDFLRKKEANIRNPAQFGAPERIVFAPLETFPAAGEGMF
jgi:hypothetical protein